MKIYFFLTIAILLTSQYMAVPMGAMELKRKLRDDCKVMLNEQEAYYKKFFLDHDDMSDKVKKKASSFETRAKSAKDV